MVDPMYNQHFMPLKFQDDHLYAVYFPNRNCFHVVSGLMSVNLYNFCRSMQPMHRRQAGHFVSFQVTMLAPPHRSASELFWWKIFAFGFLD